MSNISTFTPSISSQNEYEILRFQKDIGAELIKNIQQILRDEDINFTEDLANSFSLVMIGGQAWVESSNHYAGLVDRGLNPGSDVNFDAIHDWVRIKLGISEEPELTNVTWKIVRKIKAAGIPPKRFGKKAIKMLIAKHGVANIKSTGSGTSKKATNFQKRVKKLVKTLKKIGKKINKSIKKGIRFTRKANKIINKGVDKTFKYQKKLERYK